MFLYLICIADISFKTEVSPSPPSSSPSAFISATFSTFIRGTAADTRFLIPRICLEESIRPSYNDTTIDADGDTCFDTNKDSFGKAKLTVATSTGERLLIVRESSPSIARKNFTF